VIETAKVAALQEDAKRLRSELLTVQSDAQTYEKALTDTKDDLEKTRFELQVCEL